MTVADLDRVQVPLLEHRFDFVLAARSTTSSMRSCDSDSMISYGVMPVSRCGTCDHVDVHADAAARAHLATSSR